MTRCLEASCSLHFTCLFISQDNIISKQGRKDWMHAQNIAYLLRSMVDCLLKVVVVDGLLILLPFLLVGGVVQSACHTNTQANKQTSDVPCPTATTATTTWTDLTFKSTLHVDRQTCTLCDSQSAFSSHNSSFPQRLPRFAICTGTALHRPNPVCTLDRNNLTVQGSLSIKFKKTECFLC